MATNPILEAALRYAAKGWRVFPCHGKKQPAIKEWQRKATADYTQIKNWWLEWPTALVAIATGEESGIFVVDVDGPTGELSKLDLEVKRSKFPNTYTIKTPKGRHYYFNVPVGVRTKSTASDLGDNLDIRGDGGYVIAPPSINDEGQKYTVEAEGLPANPPEWLLDLARTDGRKKSDFKSAKILPGQRNEGLARIAGTLRNAGLTGEHLRKALRESNIQLCTVPLPENEVDKIAESISRYDPHLIGNDGRVQGQLQIKSAADIPMRPITWRWYPFIPRGAITVWGGEAGNGKSQVSCSLAAAYSTGSLMPGDESQETFEPENVLFVSAEDSPDTIINPRLTAAGADLSHIFFLSTLKDDNKPVDVDRDIGQIKAKVKELNVKLVIIDPLDAYLGTDVDSHSSADVRRVLAPLQEMAQELDISIINIGHLNKSVAMNAMQRFSGAGAFINAPRIVFMFGESREFEGEHVMACVKTNLTKKPLAMRYAIIDHHNPGIGPTSKIKWTGTTTESADSLYRVEEPGKLDDAAEWLKVILEAPMEASILLRKAKAERISPATLKRARKLFCDQGWLNGKSMVFLKGTVLQSELEMRPEEI